MDESTQSQVEELIRSVECGESADATAALQQFRTAPPDERKAAVRTLRRLATNQAELMGELLPDLAPFLTDDDRSVRLTTAKLFVAVADDAPSTVVPSVEQLAKRVADETEFYYVRARSAEALGYVALEHPDEVASPDLLADLRIGLSFDEPEVREKLAKALASVAMGDPGRLRHHTSDLAARLADENDLVRYYLCTTLAAIGCAHPTVLADAAEELATRLGDENPYVRARAGEALGLLAAAESTAVPVAPDAVSAVDGATPFVADRLAFAREALAGGQSSPDGVGTLDGIRATADKVEQAVATPNGSPTCPHCGLSLSEEAPPTCPRCGAPW